MLELAHFRNYVDSSQALQDDKTHKAAKVFFVVVPWSHISVQQVHDGG